MLYILVVVFLASLLLNPASAISGFFEEENTPVEDKGCSECKSEPLNLNPEVKEKVAEIEKAASNSLKKKENYGHEITLFIDLVDSASDAAVKALVKFKKENPSWKIGGVIVGNHRNLKEKLLQKQKLFNNGIEFSVDLSGSLAKESGISDTPAYVITYQGKQHKITGLTDLSEAVSKLGK